MRRATRTALGSEKPRWRVAVLLSDSHSRLETTRLIESAGGMVVVDSPPRPDSVALLRHTEPDVLLLAADDEPHQRRDPTRPPFEMSMAIVILANATGGLPRRAARAPGITGVLLRPLRPEQVGATLDIAVARFRELRRFRRALKDRPVVEEAKRLLMAQQGLSEPAAFGLLRKRAMDGRVRIGEVARRVIENA